MDTETGLAGLYTSAPILDYDEDAPSGRFERDEQPTEPGAATLAPEAFDAAILAALVSP